MENNRSFLSLSHLGTVTYDGLSFRSAEHAYWAARTIVPEQRELIRNAVTCERAATLGRSFPLREDWAEVEAEAMEEILRSKFTNPFLQERLHETGNDFLGEGLAAKIMTKIRSEIVLTNPEESAKVSPSKRGAKKPK